MPEVGETLSYKGQLYTAVSSYERDRKDGSTALILTWASACATCGAPFTMTTPASSKKFEPNRRCQKHKRPGHRVREVQPC